MKNILKPIVNDMCTFKITPVVCSLFVIFLIGCSGNTKKDHVDSTIQHVKAHFAPDSRSNRFNVKAKFKSDSLILSGQTTVTQAKDALLDSLSDLNATVVDHIDVLPSAKLGDKTYGLVNYSVTNIRTKHSHSAEMATQALLGMPLKLLKRHHGWYLVRTPNNYIAWAKTSNVHRINKADYNNWKNASKLIYLKTYGFSYEQPSETAEHVTDLVAGDILGMQGSQGSFYKVSYPDGRTGYIAKKEAKPFNSWDENLHLTHQSLVNVAKTML